MGEPVYLRDLLRPYLPSDPALAPDDSPLPSPAELRTGFLRAFARARRVVGSGPVELSPRTVEELALPPVMSRWSKAELYRAALMLDLLARARLEAPEIIAACYRSGDATERRAILRALPLLPGPLLYLSIAEDACRGNEQPVFEAIACENPYPGANFPDHAFNHLVLKALFLGVPLDRVIHLELRLTRELAHMVADFASERAAANRPVPADADRLIAWIHRNEPPRTP